MLHGMLGIANTITMEGAIDSLQGNWLSMPLAVGQNYGRVNTRSRVTNMELSNIIASPEES